MDGMLSTPFLRPALFLTKYLKIGSPRDDSHPIDRIVNLIVLAPIEEEHIVVLRQGVHKRSGRRNNHVILAAYVAVEDAVLAEIVAAGIGIALDQPHRYGYLVGFAGAGCHVLRLGGEGGVLLREESVVAGYLRILLRYVGVVGVYLVVCIVQRVVVADPHCSPGDVGNYRGGEACAERRAADHVAAVYETVVDVVVAVVANAVPVAVPVAGRERVDAVAEAVVVMRVVVVVRRTAVEVEVVPLTRMLRTEVVTRRLRLGVRTR